VLVWIASQAPSRNSREPHSAAFARVCQLGLGRPCAPCECLRVGSSGAHAERIPTTRSSSSFPPLRCTSIPPQRDCLPASQGRDLIERSVVNITEEAGLRSKSLLLFFQHNKNNLQVDVTLLCVASPQGKLSFPSLSDVASGSHLRSRLGWPYVSTHDKLRASDAGEERSRL